MSNSVTNVEIEDMLSSIRRLIADEPRTRSELGKPTTDRFVLTPALRVMAEETSEPTPNSGTSSVARLLSEHDASDDAELDPDVEESAAEFVTEDDGAVAAAFTSSRSALEARIAELEAAVAQSREEWEPDGSELDAKETPERHIFAHSRTKASRPEPMPETVTESVPPESFHRPKARERQEVFSTANQTPAINEPSEIQESTEDLLVDEGALRELVTEIVGQELQGPLGERITRNVRRMVRREIQQALSLKDF